MDISILYVSGYLDTWILGFHGYLDNWILGYFNFFSIWIRGLSQITFALRVGRWSEKRVVYFIKSAN